MIRLCECFSQIDLPKKELVLAHRDDTTMYDELHSQQDFKDDSRYVQPCD